MKFGDIVEHRLQGQRGVVRREIDGWVEVITPVGKSYKTVDIKYMKEMLILLQPSKFF